MIGSDYCRKKCPHFKKRFKILFWDFVVCDPVQEHRAPKEDNRIKFVRQELEKRGYEVTLDESNKCLIFEYNGNKIRIYPYTGWFTGKGIKDGRGLQKLLKQL